MEQIASGASEAAGASQEQLAAIKQVVANLGERGPRPKPRAGAPKPSRSCSPKRRCRSARRCAPSSATASRQGALVELISELERRAQDIGEITGAVEPHLRPDQSAGAQRRDRGGPRRRSRPRLRGGRRRGPRARRDVGEERAGGAEARRGDPGRRARGRRGPETSGRSRDQRIEGRRHRRRSRWMACATTCRRSPTAASRS